MNFVLVQIIGIIAWIRDCGATFLVDDKGNRRAVDWSFNAGGGLVDELYFPWDDDKITQKMCEIENSDRYHLDDFILEGGAIHVDGEGTLMVTEECLLFEVRNSSMTKEENLGVDAVEGLVKKKIEWLHPMLTII